MTERNLWAGAINVDSAFRYVLLMQLENMVRCAYYKDLLMGKDLFSSDELWKCTTCMQCLRVCPKEVDMIKIMPAIREEAVMEADVPDELQEAFENTFEYGNPLGESQRKRADWITETSSDVPLDEG